MRKKKVDTTALIVAEFEAIVRTAGAMPLTAIQIGRVREMCFEVSDAIMRHPLWTGFVKGHADFISLSEESRAILGRESTHEAHNRVAETVVEISRMMKAAGTRSLGRSI